MPFRHPLQPGQVGRTLRIRDSTARGSVDLVQAGGHKESDDYTGRNAEGAGSGHAKKSQRMTLAKIWVRTLLYSVENLNTVCDWNFFPGFRMVEGKSG